MANVGNELALLTAGNKQNFNSCTIMYGAKGMVWNKQVYIVFVKPERYTWKFMNDCDYFTVSYFPKEMNNIHKIFGYKSGRDVDKIKETGITPKYLENSVTYEEANEVFVMKKLYMKQMDRNIEPEEIIAKYDNPNDIIYGERHYLIIGEITEHIVK